jgi:hypothetical protein
MKSPVMAVSCTQMGLLKIKSSQCFNITYSNNVKGEGWTPYG